MSDQIGQIHTLKKIKPGLPKSFRVSVNHQCLLRLSSYSYLLKGFQLCNFRRRPEEHYIGMAVFLSPLIFMSR